MSRSFSKITVSEASHFDLDRSDLGFWEFDFDKDRLHLSRGLLKIIGHHSLSSQTITELLPPESINQLQTSFSSDWNKGNSFDRSIRLSLPAGEKWLRISGTKKGDKYKGLIQDESELKHWQAAQQRRAKKALEHKKILLDIANTTSKDQPVTLEQIMALVANSMNVARVGIWKFNEGRTAIDLEVLYNLSTGKYESGTRLEAKDFPSYFKALEANYNIVANDAVSDPQTCEFKTSYLEPMGITSMMDVFIQVNGQFYGIICHEHVGPKRIWTEEEQEFAASIATLISLSLERTQRSITEEALYRVEEKYKGIFNSLLNIFFEVDKNGIITEISPSCEKILGFKPSEIIGKAFDQILKINLNREKVFQHISKFGEINNLVVAAEHKNGNEIFLEVTAKLAGERNTPYSKAISIARDVTELKLAEENIHKSLREKELLLRELSHRTKNNLQVIQSMISLKMTLDDDKKLNTIAQEIISKIQTMALVHRKLYQSNNVSKVNVKEYILELADLISVSYLLSSKKVKLNIQIPEDLEMKIDTITPFGLVINELLSNSFKYAFDSTKEGSISIVLNEKSKDQVSVTYFDNGKGFEDGYNPTKAEGLGLPTVYTLVNKQMMGQMLQPDPHKAYYEIEFPMSVHSDRI